MTSPVVHIIGGGLAGLAAAVRLTKAGRSVTVYEMAGYAGGRCRSFLSPALGRRIDNGNHLMLSGNVQAMAYLDDIGASGSLWQPRRAAFAFADLKTGHRWSIRPGGGRLPLWLLDKRRRVPGCTVFQHLAAINLLWAPRSATVAERFHDDSRFYKLFLEPLAIAVLNTDPQEAAASLLSPVLKQTLGRGEAACRPCIPKRGLSESLIDPALEFIRSAGGEIRFRHRVAKLQFDGDSLKGFALGDGAVSLADGDAVIVATPPEAANGLIPGLKVPRRCNAIVNVHFLIENSVREPGFTGIVNGNSQWIFVRGNVASVTISAAGELVGLAADEIVALVWPEVRRVLDLPDLPPPPYGIVKEKRATIAQTPEQELRRPATETPWRNLMLAGDWTATGLPATIEGAVSSGNRAAAAVLRR